MRKRHHTHSLRIKFLPDQWAKEGEQKYYSDLGTHGFKEKHSGVLVNVAPIVFPKGKYTILKVGVFTVQEEKHVADVDLLRSVTVNPGDQVQFPPGSFTIDVGGMSVFFEDKTTSLHRCRYCGFENFHDSRRCKSCGALPQRPI